jgi:hypothetical protein
VAYRSVGAFLDFEEALYFSMTSFTTAGYGDLVPPVKWRLLGASEAMVGMVLLGWSAGLVLVLLERMNRRVALPKNAPLPKKYPVCPKSRFNRGENGRGTTEPRIPSVGQRVLPLRRETLCGFSLADCYC